MSRGGRFRCKDKELVDDYLRLLDEWRNLQQLRDMPVGHGLLKVVGMADWHVSELLKVSPLSRIHLTASGKWSILYPRDELIGA